MSEPANAELLAAARDAAARGVDYYALLGLDAPSDSTPVVLLTPESVHRAWRKRSVKYHPDKVRGDDKFDQARWEEFGLARDVLASGAAREVYDGARQAAARRRGEKEAMGARQRRLVEELEEAEARARAGPGAQQQKKAEEDEGERARQAAVGRRFMEERHRLFREAEERERERERERSRREDEELDERERELVRKLEERAKKRARKMGPGAADADAVDAQRQPSPPEPRPAAEGEGGPPAAATQPLRREEVKPADPVQFLKTQWPKTRDRLRAAQAAKELRMKKAGQRPEEADV